MCVYRARVKNKNLHFQLIVPCVSTHDMFYCCILLLHAPIQSFGSRQLCTVILIFKGPETFQTQSHFFGITKFRNGACVIIGCTLYTDAMPTLPTMMPPSQQCKFFFTMHAILHVRILDPCRSFIFF